ncbi:MAG: hypothetical protein NC253_13080 [Ruminococcus sp.]|nr:hypothetical protein [Ruminococcus sp.]MCM1382657.1 hypothetical protein [Muribaculaceae bacterium]MCM1479740.1 hypothetical protein [Muribaculaceae bacterium]
MNKNETADLDLKLVRNVPGNVITAMRRLFPEQSSNGDLISAFVYVFTNGNCQISPKAMELVRSYRNYNGNQEILDRLDNIEKVLRELNKRIEQ